MDDFKKIVSDNIIALRTAHKLTQFELGEKLNYSDKAISKWERGEAVPDAFVLKHMGEIFGVSVDYIISEHNEEEPKPITPIKQNNRLMITLISIIGTFTLFILVFVIFLLLEQIIWLTFVYAVPVSLVILIVFNSIWGKAKYNFYLISLLVWSILATVYLTFLEYNWWPLFLIGIPSQLIILLSFRLKCRHN